MIKEANGKTLIIKDGDTLMASENIRQILSEARDVYDRVSRAHYRHGLNRVYESVNLTIIICGTGALRALDTSELGERFLNFIIADGMDAELERTIGWRVINRAHADLSIIANGKADQREGPEMVKFKQLAGGYVQFLRDNAKMLLDDLRFPDWAKRRCMDLAELIAFMRSRPSIRQGEKAEREMSFRLTSQLGRLACCMAAVLGRKEVDDEVMKRVNRVALDTAGGRVFELTKHMAKEGANGLSLAQLSRFTGHHEDEEKKLLKHMRTIKAAEVFHLPTATGLRAVPRHRLTPRLQRLWEEVMRDV